jgi:tetratricopeptide (TPR) repeat protein
MAKTVVKKLNEKEPARTFENQDLQVVDAQTPSEFLLRGWGHRVKHRLTEAEADFLKVLGVEPKNVDAQYGLAQVYMEQEKKDEAIKAFNAAAKMLEDGALSADPVRSSMLRRAAHGHAARLKTGAWDLENIGNALPKAE